MGCGGGGKGVGGGVSEGQGQRRMAEVVRRNSGHNAAECKDPPLKHGGAPGDYRSAFPELPALIHSHK